MYYLFISNIINNYRIWSKPKDNTKKDKANEENQNNMQIELQEGSKIDVKNLENAKIENGMKVNNSPKAQEEKR